MLKTILLLFLVSSSSSSFAQSHELTPFAGIQAGGSVTSFDRHGDVDPSATFGFMLSFQREPQAILDLVLSHQPTSADLSDFFEVTTDDVAVTYAQIGGRYLFHPERRVDPYIALTAGGTRIAVGDDWALAFSFAAGGGTDIRLTPRTALRLDDRYYVTLRDTSSAIGCSTGSGSECSFTSSGRNFTQFAGTAGLVVKF